MNQITANLMPFRNQVQVASKSIKALTLGSSTEEITDSVFDVTKSIYTVESSLEDDFQFTDVLGWLSLEKEGKELINDAPVFAAQFISAVPQKVKEAVEEADRRFVQAGMTYGKVSKAFINGIYLLACWYSTGATAYQGFNQNIDLSKKLFAGQRILPS